MSAAKLSPARLMQIINAPLVSEKGTRVGEKFNQMIFKVVPDATKPEIKAAVELLFKVHVEAVQVANQKGKVKRFARYVGRRKNWKKAFVRLKAGEEIQLGPAE